MHKAKLEILAIVAIFDHFIAVFEKEFLVYLKQKRKRNFIFQVHPHKY
jgi:hypothetical protein